MSAHKLMLNCIEIDTFYLCAIHSSLPSYKMAFLLNKFLGLQFARYSNDIEVVGDRDVEVYPCYVFEDKENYTKYSLLKNKCFSEKKNNNELEDLFNNGIQQSVKNLIPEYKRVDFFLKVETDNVSFNMKLLATRISSINQVIASFEVDYSNVKSKNNLIIE